MSFHSRIFLQNLVNRTAKDTDDYIVKSQECLAIRWLPRSDRNPAAKCYKAGTKGVITTPWYDLLPVPALVNSTKASSPLSASSWFKVLVSRVNVSQVISASPGCPYSRGKRNNHNVSICPIVPAPYARFATTRRITCHKPLHNGTNYFTCDKWISQAFQASSNSTPTRNSGSFRTPCVSFRPLLFNTSQGYFVKPLRVRK